MSRTPAKRPWYARLTRSLADTVTHRPYASLAEDGFTRQVQFTLQLPEPGKGRNAALRDIILRLNPDDADALAAKLTEEAAAVRNANATQGDGGQYTGPCANIWPPANTTRRVPKTGTWGRLYAEPGGTGDFTEGLVTEVTATEVIISEGHTPPGNVVRLPRTDTDLSRFVTDTDNWETL